MTHFSILRRHSDLLIFSLYVAIFSAGWVLFAELTRPFPHHRIRIVVANLVEETALVFVLAFLAGVIGSLIVRRHSWPTDGFFAFLAAWLSFGALSDLPFVYGGIKALFLGSSQQFELGTLVAAALATPILALIYGSVPALLSCIIYQIARFVIVGKLRPSRRASTRVLSIWIGDFSKLQWQYPAKGAGDLRVLLRPSRSPSLKFKFASVRSHSSSRPVVDFELRYPLPDPADVGLSQLTLDVPRPEESAEFVRLDLSGTNVQISHLMLRIWEREDNRAKIQFDAHLRREASPHVKIEGWVQVIAPEIIQE